MENKINHIVTKFNIILTNIDLLNRLKKLIRVNIC
jgi:DNA repair photolyase